MKTAAKKGENVGEKLVHANVGVVHAELGYIPYGFAYFVRSFADPVCHESGSAAYIHVYEVPFEA